LRFAVDVTFVLVLLRSSQTLTQYDSVGLLTSSSSATSSFIYRLRSSGGPWELLRRGVFKIWRGKRFQDEDMKTDGVVVFSLLNFEKVEESLEGIAMSISNFQNHQYWILRDLRFSRSITAANSVKPHACDQRVNPPMGLQHDVCFPPGGYGVPPILVIIILVMIFLVMKAAGFLDHGTLHRLKTLFYLLLFISCRNNYCKKDGRNNSW